MEHDNKHSLNDVGNVTWIRGRTHCDGNSIISLSWRRQIWTSQVGIVAPNRGIHIVTAFLMAGSHCDDNDNFFYLLLTSECEHEHLLPRYPSFPLPLPSNWGKQNPFHGETEWRKKFISFVVAVTVWSRFIWYIMQLTNSFLFSLPCELRGYRVVVLR